jgi:hypothetical protein
VLVTLFPILAVLVSIAGMIAGAALFIDGSRRLWESRLENPAERHVTRRVKWASVSRRTSKALP